MKKLTWVLVAALLAGVATVGATGCGDAASDTTTTTTATADGNAIDRAFIAAMIPHHESAVAMAAIAEDEATSDFVTTLAGNITRTQTSEIALMRRIDEQLDAAGVKTGDLGMSDHAMGMDMTADDLRGAKPFDDAFMQAMVPHHEGAIAMAKAELDKGRSPELMALARDVIAAQEQEVSQMNEHMRDTPEMDAMHHG